MKVMKSDEEIFCVESMQFKPFCRLFRCIFNLISGFCINRVFLLSGLLTILILISVRLEAQEYRHDSLSVFIASIVDAMPRRDSNGFSIPVTTDLLHFAVLLDSLISGNCEAADSMSDLLDYHLVNWEDAGDSDRLYQVLYEDGSEISDSVKKGWGVYIKADQYERNIIIESPHPLWDSRSWLVAFRAFKQLRARFFIMAGAHRYANGRDPAPADVAHSIHNLFHIAHVKFSLLADRAVQIHGFKADSTNQYYGYPDIVLSSGKSEPEAILDSLSNEFLTEGFSVGIYDGENYTHLGATTNVQGQYSNANGLSFIHIELERNIRYSDEKIALFVNALERGLPCFPADIKYVDSAPARMRLLGSFPNPFNAMLTIEYELKKISKVEFRIYSITGREIRKERLGFLPAGSYTLTWDGKDSGGRYVSSGIYFYELSTGEERLSGRCSLLR